MKTSILVLISFLSTIFITFSADSTGLLSKFGYDYNISGGHYYHGGGDTPGDNDNSYIKEVRRKNAGIDSEYYFLDTDCPLYHGAAYVDFNGRIKGWGFDVNAHFVAEHRGISYGVFSTDNMIFYPRINFGLDTTVCEIFGKEFRAGVNVGNYDQVCLYEGLNFYNFDAQGSYFFVEWDKFRFAFQRYGDLLFGYGLGIGDSDDWILSAEGFEIFKNYKMDIRAGLYNYAAGDKFILSNENYDNGMTFSIGLYDSSSRVYAQYAQRAIYDENIDAKYRSAFLAGAKTKGNFWGINYYGLLEYRWFGYYYNLGYITPGSLFRDNEETGCCKTIGDNLYPIYVFDRPFSQWAVYTEYQNMNVHGLTFRLNADYFIYKKIKLFYELDYNYIQASNLESTEFPFYNAGLAWEPIPGNYISISRTNKTMNMNIHYPAFYLYDIPAMLLKFKFDIDRSML